MRDQFAVVFHHYTLFWALRRANSKHVCFGSSLTLSVLAREFARVYIRSGMLDT